VAINRQTLMGGTSKIVEREKRLKKMSLFVASTGRSWALDVFQPP
jgi:hypothetical protein